MRNKFNTCLAIVGLVTLSIGTSLAQTPDQVTDFTSAAKFDDIGQVKSLLDAGVSPNTIDPKGNPMLIVAIQDNSNKVVDLLLADKATDVNLANKSGETPLMMAALENNYPLVQKMVLNTKADINRTGWTPLHYAATAGNLEITQFLLNQGAMVNARSPNETTPLMMAVFNGNEQVIKVLLDKGADLKMRNDQGYTAIDVATAYNKEEVQKGLQSRWLKLYKEAYPGGPKPKP
jgi:uncharacterized protein